MLRSRLSALAALTLLAFGAVACASDDGAETEDVEVTETEAVETEEETETETEEETETET